jgi:putative intracellular protease/amidase
MTYQSVPGKPAQGLSLSGPAITVTTTSAVVLAANHRRNRAILINDSDTVMYLARGDQAALNSGIRLNAGGGSWTEEPDNRGHIYTGPIAAICTASKTLLVTEEF